MMRGMDDGVEQAQLLRIGKHLGAELLPVDAAAGIEDLFPEALDDFLISGLRRAQSNRAQRGQHQ
jgi:hypothetical protein